MALGRIVSVFLAMSGWLLFGARVMLDAVGYSTLPEDAIVASERVSAFLIWLSGIPWWALFGFALVSTAILIFAVWPRTIVVKAVGSGIADYSKGQELTPMGVGIMLDGLDHGECAVMVMLTIRNRSAHDMKLLADEMSIHIDGAKLDLNETKFPVQITADSTAVVPIYSGRFKRYEKEARGSFRATIRFGRDARCNSAVIFSYDFHLVAAPHGGWNAMEPVPQTLTLLEYSMKT